MVQNQRTPIIVEETLRDQNIDNCNNLAIIYHTYYKASETFMISVTLLGDIAKAFII